jgi:hypothetical protein
MSPRTDLDTPDDVVARLREGAHAVPDVRIDTPTVVATARQALRRRRRRQAAVGVVAAGLVALTVASPVHVPGIGTLTMPGGQQVRTVFGVEVADSPGPAPGIDLGELFALFRADPPAPETMEREVASLQTHVLPLIEEIQATWYEESACNIVEYGRGTFSDDGECGGRPGEQQFDTESRADFDRLIDAVDRSGVATKELLNATYDPDGHIESAAFDRPGGGIQWNYAYIYSPDEKPREWDSPLGPVTVTPIGDTGWWFEKSPDD